MKNSVLVVGGIFTILFFVDKFRFPVTYEVCNNLYEDCFAVAKFDDMESCQRASEVGDWLCDSLTDPENITCKPKHNSSVTSLCTKKILP